MARELCRGCGHTIEITQDGVILDGVMMNQNPVGRVGARVPDFCKRINVANCKVKQEELADLPGDPGEGDG